MTPLANFQTSLLSLGRLEVNHHAFVTRRHLDELSWIDHASGWLQGADDLLATFAQELPWRRGKRPMYGDLVEEPRLNATLGSEDLQRWPVLEEVRHALERRYGPGLVDGFVNYYRDGRDSVAWHSDRIGTHQIDPVVALVSLGGPRRFQLRPLYGGSALRLVVESGDLLVMGGACQHTWQHAVPKMAVAAPRMSISYRHVQDTPGDDWWYSTAVDKQ